MRKFSPSICYRIEYKTESPLTVGSGESTYTDHDVAIDNNGFPVIPATSLAGVMRSFFEKGKATEIFGSIEIGEDKKNDSRIRVYDAECVSDENGFYIANRDSVKLKEKVAADGAKFDMQAVETGAVFVSYVELLDASYAEDIEGFFTAVNSGEVRFGAKTTRGYGQMSVSVKKKDLNTVDEWLDFNMFDDAEWDGTNKMELNKPSNSKISLRIKLKSKSGISIREYSTDVNQADYKTLTLKNETPVIPGTSWAGVFRSRFEEVAGSDATRELFGYVEEKTGNSAKSKVVFSESVLEEGMFKVISRNAIDRFSGGTKDGALYTEKTYYDGKTTLVVQLDKDVSKNELIALGICLADLHNGLLCVGGLTSVGRGLFKIESINNDEKLTEYVTGETPDIKAFAEEVFNCAD